MSSSTSADMGPKPNRGSRRTHLLGGCDNCRKRHTKCDQVQPKCLTCQAVGLECQGYDSSVQWVTHGERPSLEEKSGTRRYLYTERSRRLMSKQLIDQVGVVSLNSSLETLDAWSHAPVGNDALAIGPFSVIDFSTDKMTTLQEEDLVVLESIISPVTPVTPSSLGAAVSVPDYLQWSDLFDLELETWLDTQPDDFNLGPMVLSTSDSPAQRRASCVMHNISLTETQFGLNDPLNSLNDKELRDEAPFLLKNFSQVVISALAALPIRKKSPYEILNVANAIQTLADISYLNRPVKHANTANLCAALASSSYHMASSRAASVTKPTYWRELSTRAGLLAKMHLQKSLQLEFYDENKAKYKDQLMALLCVMAYSIMVGHQDDVRCYMIDAERLLRVRGLAKRHISRRARLLHHMYTWNRIVGESTYVLHDQKPHLATTIPHMPSFMPPRISDTGHNTRLDDFLRIEHSDGHDTDSEAPKDTETGLHDIHLKDPRSYPDTMYIQIYGLPETWLSLLSQTTRLANAVELNKSTPDTDSVFRQILDKRAGKLEDLVCSFATRSSNLAIQSTSPSAPTQYMLHALNSALVIYFYRRIRNVNPLILQSHVDEVLDALRNYDLSVASQVSTGPGTGWPAFIAGCEASVGARREFSISWLENAHVKTGVQGYKCAQSLMLKVWTRRDSIAPSPKPTRTDSNRLGHPLGATTWMQVARETKQWPILC